MEQIQATRGSGVTTSGDLSLSDTFAQSTYVRWTKQTFNVNGQLTATRVYHSIPTSGSGKKNYNYTETTFTYDNMNRQSAVTTPGGTSTFTTFDTRGLPADRVGGGFQSVPGADARPFGRTRPTRWTWMTTAT